MSQPLLSDGGAFYQLQEEMRAAFECTVIDLPRHMVIQHPHLMNEIQSVVVVSELTLVGARDVIRILSWLKANAPHSNVLVALNRVGPNGTTELTKKDFESSIERKSARRRKSDLNSRQSVRACFLQPMAGTKAAKSRRQRPENRCRLPTRLEACGHCCRRKKPRPIRSLELQVV